MTGYLTEPKKFHYILNPKPGTYECSAKMKVKNFTTSKKLWSYNTDSEVGRVSCFDAMFWCDLWKNADAISWTKTDWKAQTFGYIIWALLSVTSILKNIVATWQACVWDLKMVHKQKTVMNKLRSQQNVFDDNRDQYETSGGVCWVIWDVNNVSEISNTPKIYFSPGARYSQFFCTKSFRVVIIRGLHITKWLHDALIKREKVANIDPAQTIFYRDYAWMTQFIWIRVWNRLNNTACDIFHYFSSFSFEQKICVL